MNTMKFYNHKGDCLRIKITQNEPVYKNMSLPNRRKAVIFANSKGFYRKQDL